MARSPRRGSAGVALVYQGPNVPSSVFLSPEGDREASDFQQPTHDRRSSNQYGDRANLSSYQTNRGEQFRTDADFELGYGCTEEDAQRGWIEPRMREEPAFDLVNYKDRSTQPSKTNEDFENTSSFDRDYEFRGRNRESKGFLTRPRLPTER